MFTAKAAVSPFVVILSAIRHTLHAKEILSYLAQSNKMLKYKNDEFLQIFAKKRALLTTFDEFL